MNIHLGKWTEKKIDRIIHESSRIKETGSRIEFLSGQFLVIKYKESTLTGDMDTPEAFVINLEAVDCFTFIDYVEAMRLSGSFDEFKKNLKKIRYRSGKVGFEQRNHFFTDWREYNPAFVVDVTEQIGSQKTKVITKILNIKEDGTYFLKGIQPKKRKIHYIPSEALDNTVIKKLRTGDYAGIYSDRQGLDVSHVGIVIKKGDSVYLRHASSAAENRKVIDQDLKKYMKDKPGIIIFRPKNAG